MRGTLAWADLVGGAPSVTLPLLVECSAGTKTKKSRHSSPIELYKVPTGEGGGDFLRFLLGYSQATESCGAPLILWLLFPNRGLRDGIGSFLGAMSSGALRQRLVLHLTTAMGLWEGETLHNFRRGGSQHQHALGVDRDTLARKRLWRSQATVDLYLHPHGHLGRLR